MIRCCYAVLMTVLSTVVELAGWPMLAHAGLGSRLRYELQAPPPTGNPVQTSGAGNRGGLGNCPMVEVPLTALVPTTKLPNQTLVWGRTMAAQPTLWVYVPYALTPERPAELRLKAADQTAYRSLGQITHAPAGIIGVQLPPEEALQPNELYYWSFVVRCDRNDASANQFVKAAVQHIAPAPALTAQLQHANSADKAAILARAGLWYDALTQVARLRSEQPHDAAVKADWQVLLADGGLPNLAAIPIVSLPAQP